MKTPRFLRFLILLLAVWLPLDNAVAGAVIVDCPLMSNAFEDGLQATLGSSAIDRSLMPQMPGMAQLPRQSMVSDHTIDCPKQCGVCLLLGSMALPSLHTTATSFSDTAVYLSPAQTQAPVGVVTHPFRPPIV